MTDLSGELAAVDLLGEAERWDVYLAALSWEAGYQRALRDAAERSAGLDAAWREAGRRAWKERVAARVTEFEADATEPAWPGHQGLSPEDRRALYRRVLATWR